MYAIRSYYAAVAMGAGEESPFGKSGFDPLAAHFQQAELTADVADGDSGLVHFQGLFEAFFDFADVFAIPHVDEVDDDQPAA